MALSASNEERPLGPAELLVCVLDRSGVVRAADPGFVARTGLEPGSPSDGLPIPTDGAAYVRWEARDGSSFPALALAVALDDGVFVAAFRPSTDPSDAGAGAVAAPAAFGRFVGATA